MKKQPVSALFAVTVLFAVFTAGFVLGRGFHRTDVQVSSVLTEPTHFGVTAETIPDSAEAATEAIMFPININAAGKEELTALPGIGEELASRILKYRDTKGSFSRVEELLNVDGIGPGKLEGILDLVTTGG